MRIALVNPITRRTQGYHTIGTYIPQLGLQVLADLVPPEHHVDIIDEVFGTAATDALIRDGRYDLVGLTSYTSGATRAYEISAGCRKRGIATIIGGPHAGACPDEAAEYFDSVAVGECDEIWPQIIADAAGGRLQRRYEGQLSDLERLDLKQSHLRALSGLPNVAEHRDPFDHLLIAQARAEDLTFLSNDAWVRHYPVRFEPCSTPRPA